MKPRARRAGNNTYFWNSCAGATPRGEDTVRPRLGRSSLSVSHRNSLLYGAFVRARRALNGQRQRLENYCGRIADGELLMRTTDGPGQDPDLVCLPGSAACLTGPPSRGLSFYRSIVLSFYRSICMFYLSFLALL